MMHLLACVSFVLFALWCWFISFSNFLICRLRPDHQLMWTITRGCQSQVLLRLLILEAQHMSIKNTTILSPPGITVLLRLFLVWCCFVLCRNFCCHWISGSSCLQCLTKFQDLDGVIHVTCGVLDVFWLSCARYVNFFRVCWHALTDIAYKIIFNIYSWEKICFFFREKLCFRHMKTWSTWPWWKGFLARYLNTC